MHSRFVTQHTIAAKYISAGSPRAGDGAVIERWTDIIDRHRENRHLKPQLPLCRSCIDFSKARQNGIRAWVWSELPKIFDLKVEDGDEDDATSAVTYA